MRPEGSAMVKSPRRSVQLGVKRVFDITVAVILLFITMPVIAMAGALIVIEDRGPVFYTQRRVGYRAQEFTVRKLRSMRVNTLAVAEVGEVSRDNPLVTRVGSFIRR